MSGRSGVTRLSPWRHLSAWSWLVVTGSLETRLGAPSLSVLVASRVPTVERGPRRTRTCRNSLCLSCLPGLLWLRFPHLADGWLRSPSSFGRSGPAQIRTAVTATRRPKDTRLPHRPADRSRSARSLTVAKAPGRTVLNGTEQAKRMHDGSEVGERCGSRPSNPTPRRWTARGLGDVQLRQARPRAGARRGTDLTVAFMFPAAVVSSDASSGGPKRQRGPIQGGKHPRLFPSRVLSIPLFQHE